MHLKQYNFIFVYNLRHEQKIFKQHFLNILKCT